MVMIHRTQSDPLNEVWFAELRVVLPYVKISIDGKHYSGNEKKG